MNRDTCSSLLWIAVLVTAPVATAVADDWPQFLGPSRNGQAHGKALAEKWPESGPRVVWTKKVGMAFSAPVVAKGRLYVFHRQGNEEILQCLNAETGDEHWRYATPTSYKDGFQYNDGPWATPTVHGDRILILGAGGTLSCLDDKGKKIWSVETHKKFRIKDRFFGDACSPLVEGDLVLLNVGAEDGAGVVAFKMSDGSVVWKSAEHEASYSSPVVATLGGKRRAFFFTRKGLLVLDPASGAIEADFYWRPRIHSSVNAVTPIVENEQIFISTSYGVGATLLKLADGEAKTVWESSEAMENHYATCVYRKGFLFGYHGQEGYDPVLRCIDFTTGKVRWTEKPFGAGTVIVAGEHLLLMAVNGELTLARATPERFERLARAKILAPTVRAYAALAGGKFYARNSDTLVCVDLGTKSK